MGQLIKLLFVFLICSLIGKGNFHETHLTLFVCFKTRRDHRKIFCECPVYESVDHRSLFYFVFRKLTGYIIWFVKDLYFRPVGKLV